MKAKIQSTRWSTVYYLLLFLIFLGLATTATGQRVKINWSENQKGSEALLGRALFHERGSDDIYILEGSCGIIWDKKKSEMQLTRLDTSFNVIAEESLDNLTDDLDLHFKKVIQTRDKTLLLTYKYEEKNDKFFLYTSTLENGGFHNAQKAYEHYFNINNIIVDFLSTYKFDVEGEIVLSADSSTIAFANQLYIYDTKKENDQIAIAVFDENMVLLWEKVQEFPYPDKFLHVEKMLVGNNRKDIFLLAAYELDTKNKIYDYKIFHITPESLKEYKIDLDWEFYPGTMDAVLDDDKSILLFTGLYNSKEKGNVKGVFGGQLFLNELENNFIKHHLFSVEDRRRLYESYSPDYNYSIVDHKRLNNGNIHVLAEHREYYTMDSQINYGDRFYTGLFETEGHYLKSFKEFIVFVLNENGELLNYSIIDRNLKTSRGRLYCSFLVNKEKSYLLFYTKLLEEDKEKYQLKKALYDQATKLIQVDDDGSMLSDELLIYYKTNTFMFDQNLVFFRNDQLTFGGKIWGDKQKGSKMALKFGMLDTDSLK